MKFVSVFVVGSMIAAITACGSAASEGSLVFGDQEGPCTATILRNEIEDERDVDEGAACFLGEVDAERAVVWDVLAPTVEGDPILIRYDFDGETVTITTDSTRDEFGNGRVTAQRCEGVQPTRWLPEGVECQGASAEGFRSDSLPNWP